MSKVVVTLDGDGKAKGKGKGKGKGKLNLLAIEDGEEDDPAPEPTPQELLDVALTQVRKMRSLLSACHSTYEECAQKLQESKCKFWSKDAKKDADAQLQKLADESGKVKKFLLGKNLTEAGAKSLMMHAAEVIKESNAQIKEMRHLAAQTGSVASRSSKKQKK
jgi:hypothetical protein